MNRLNVIIRRNENGDFFSGEYTNIITIDGIETKIQFSNLLLSDLRVVLSTDDAIKEMRDIFMYELSSIYPEVTDSDINSLIVKCRLEMLPEYYVERLREFFK